MNPEHKSETTISDYLHISRRYTRSIQIERDYRDPQALDGYTVTPTVQYALHQLSAGFRTDSSQRAWRVTGPYGAGKSAFGVFAANLISRSDAGYPIAASILKRVSEETAAAVASIPRYLPIPITGSRARFGDVLLSSLVHVLEGERTAGRNPSALVEVKEYLRGMSEGQVGDTRAIQLISDIAHYVRRSSLPYDGILILIDEMGKFLEYAAIRPNKTDAFLFQRLAELASGSAAVPLAVIGFLHHQFADYAIGYGQRAEEEWAKVAERFEEIPFDESPEQCAFLLAGAIENDASMLKQSGITAHGRKLYQRALTMGISVMAKRKEDLLSVSSNLYPIHPATLVILASGMKRFGQNERSLFSFLLSHEPYAFQQFISTKPFHREIWYRVSDLCDYLAAIGSLRFREGDRRRRWEHLRSTLTANAGLTETEQHVLKVVGLINVLEPLQGMKADEPTVTFALHDVLADKEVSEALLSLAQRGILYQRSAQKDYCLWSNTSVDLQALYEEAERQIPPIANLEAFVGDLPQTRPILAHRHYHRTGTLRAFAIRYETLETLEHRKGCADLGGFDGQILIIPIEFGESFDRAREVASRAPVTKDQRVLVHLLEVTPAELATARELRLWQWIQNHCQELRVDDFARSEVKRRLDELSCDLEGRLSSFLAFEGSATTRRGAWYYQSHELEIPDRKSLNQKLSDIFDKMYHASPLIKNELINRARLSSSVASARTKLIARMLEHQKSEHLGLTGTPPELAIYLSVFNASKLHRGEDGVRGFYPPTDDDPCNWGKVWHDLRALLRQSGETSVDALLSTLEQPPYGIRQGVSPLFLAAFILSYRQDISLFERGTYVVQVTEHHFMRLLKATRNFSLRFVPNEPGSASLIPEDWHTLDVLKKCFDATAPTLTDVVRELYRWVTSLPSYAMKTRRISKTAERVRTVLLKSSDPMELLYEALPRACGVESVANDGQFSAAEQKLLLETLNDALNELAQAGRRLRHEVEYTLFEALQLGETIKEVRANIEGNYAPFGAALTDHKVKSFLGRVSDPTLSDEKWVESIATLLTGKMLLHWQDETLESFKSEIRVLAGQLKRWIGLMIGRIKDQPLPDGLVSVTVTRADGNELALAVVKNGRLSGKLERLKEQVKSVLSRDVASAPVVLAQLLAEIIENRSLAVEERLEPADNANTPHS
jgi:hypothetical protein